MAGGASSILTVPPDTDRMTLASLAACCKDVAQTEAALSKTRPLRDLSPSILLVETSFCVPTVYEGALWHLESEGNMNSLGVSCSYVSRRSTSHFTSPQIQALDVALLAKKTKFGKVTPKPLC